MEGKKSMLTVVKGKLTYIRVLFNYSYFFSDIWGMR